MSFDQIQQIFHSNKKPELTFGLQKKKPDLKRHNVSVETASGIERKLKQVGTLRLEIEDDSAIKHSYDLPGVVYDPDSPYGTLGYTILERIFCQERWECNL